MTLGNAVKLIRTARGMRQRDLARQIGVSANYLSMIEAGRREPSVSILSKIAAALDVPAGLFLLWTESETTRLTKSKLRQVRDLLTRIQAIYLEEENNPSAEDEEPAA